MAIFPIQDRLAEVDIGWNSRSATTYTYCAKVFLTQKMEIGSLSEGKKVVVEARECSLKSVEENEKSAHAKEKACSLVL